MPGENPTTEPIHDSGWSTPIAAISPADGPHPLDGLQPSEPEAEPHEKAMEWPRMCGDAVRFFVLRIMLKPGDERTANDRAFLRGLIPILKARKRFVESMMADCMMELEIAEGREATEEQRKDDALDSPEAAS